MLLAAAPVLAACGNGGLRPLYGVTASGAGMQERMAQVEVAPIPGRVGQRIRNEVIFQNTGGGSPLPPTHRLELSTNESVLFTLMSIDGTAAGQVYSLYVSFRLVEISTKKVVLQGSSNARAGFERFTSIYSNVRAREDAENRAARVISDDVKTRIATYLSRAA